MCKRGNIYNQTSNLQKRQKGAVYFFLTHLNFVSDMACLKVLGNFILFLCLILNLMHSKWIG